MTDILPRVVIALLAALDRLLGAGARLAGTLEGWLDRRGVRWATVATQTPAAPVVAPAPAPARPADGSPEYCRHAALIVYVEAAPHLSLLIHRPDPGTPWVPSGVLACTWGEA